MSPTIFISYASEDEEIAGYFENWLSEIFSEINLFWAKRDLTSGVWMANLRGKLHESRVILVIVTSNSQNNPWVHFEAGAGFAEDKTLPVVVGDLKFENVSGPFRQLQSHLATETDLRKLATAIAQKTDQRPPRRWSSLKKLLNKIDAVATRRSESTNYFEHLSLPDKTTQRFARAIGNHKPVVGSVIEIWSHHSLDSFGNLSDVGVDPTKIKVIQPAARKNFGDLLHKCGGLKNYSGANKPKFGVARLPFLTVDAEDYTMEMYETDFVTWRSVREVVEKDTPLRHELIHTIPEKNQVPQSMSLQYLIRFRNGDVLAMKRDPQAAVEANKWSFSGEEQFDEKDFEGTPGLAAFSLFQRAIVEEVLGGRVERQDKLEAIWREIALPRIASYRLWSFFLEEAVGAIQMFGVFQLRIDPPDLRALHESNARTGKNTTDDEGELYVVDQKGVQDLLTEDWCTAHRLHGKPESVEIDAIELHTTSRYRLWRLYCALYPSRK